MTAFNVPTETIQQQVQQALAEDIGSGDVTARLIPPQQTSNATVISREAAIICGQAWFTEVFRQLDPAISIEWHIKDGDTVQTDELVCKLRGPAQTLLSGERTALNFLQTLSATATHANQYVKAIAGTAAQVLDTRKTIPGLRLAQKYAVSCGGAANHRIGLYDMVLIKENHILAAGSISNAVTKAKQLAPDFEIEVEVESLDELNEALTAGAKRILLDNMSNTLLREAVSLNQGRAKLEASGGVSLQTIRAIAETGVDFISVGAVTKDIKAIDLSMRFELS